MEQAENVAETRGCGIFTPKEAAESFNALFLDEKHCTWWVLNKLHPEGAKCPDCKAEIEEPESFWQLKRCHCKSCGKWFTVTTGTILQGIQLRPDEIYLLAVLSGLNVDLKEIARIVKVHPDTVRIWQDKFRAMEIFDNPGGNLRLIVQPRGVHPLAAAVVKKEMNHGKENS